MTLGELFFWISIASLAGAAVLLLTGLKTRSRIQLIDAVADVSISVITTFALTPLLLRMVMPPVMKMFGIEFTETWYSVLGTGFIFMMFGMKARQLLIIIGDKFGLNLSSLGDKDVKQEK